MANVKKLGTSKIVPGNTVYCIIRRELDDFRLDDADGLTFAAAPADPYVSLTEDSAIKGLYEVSESRVAWNDGRYRAFIYIQSGASPAPVDDALVDQMDFWVLGDLIVNAVPWETGTVQTDAANSTISFKTDLASTTDGYCNGSFVKFTSGALINQTKKIATPGYGGTSKLLQVTSGFTEIPTAGDTFIIINQ